MSEWKTLKEIWDENGKVAVSLKDCSKEGTIVYANEQTAAIERPDLVIRVWPSTSTLWRVVPKVTKKTFYRPIVLYESGEIDTAWNWSISKERKDLTNVIGWDEREFEVPEK